MVVALLYDLLRKSLDGHNVAGISRHRPHWDVAAGYWLWHIEFGQRAFFRHRHSGTGFIFAVVEVPLFGCRQQICNVHTRVEPGKAGKVIRGQMLDLSRWSMAGIVGNRHLAEHHAATRPAYFVVRMLGEFILGVAHKNSEFP